MSTGRDLVFLTLLAAAGCAAEDPAPLAERSAAHTTLTPGTTAWVRMFGGTRIQRWHRVDAHEASRLTWVIGENDAVTQLVAYDPYGSRVVEEQVGQSWFGSLDLAAGHDDSRTMTRVGDPDGFGCAPADAPLVLELAQVELDGTCRWLHSFPREVSFGPELQLAAGVEGTVVVAGHTRQVLHFGDTAVGADVPDLSRLPAAFVVRLDAATGEVLWQTSLGAGEIADVDVDLGDRVVVGLRTSFSGGWAVWAGDPDGNERWRRILPTSVTSLSVAGSPAGEVVAAGSYSGTFTGTTFPSTSGDGSNVYIVRYRAISGALGPARWAGGSAYATCNGVDIDHHGKVVVAGTFANGSFTVGSNTYASPYRGRAWAAELTPQLEAVRWTRAFGEGVDGSWAVFRDVAYTSNSRSMVAGELHGTVDFGGATRTGSEAAVLVRILP